MSIAEGRTWLIAGTGFVLLVTSGCAPRHERAAPAPVQSPARIVAYAYADGGAVSWNMDALAGAGFSAGAPLGVLHAAQLVAMTERNVIAHLRTADSLHVVLSALALQRAANANVREVARLLVDEHVFQWQLATSLGQMFGYAPQRAPFDSLDDVLMRRLLPELDGLSADSADTHAIARFERAFMGLQLLLHEHQLAELTALRRRQRAPWLRQIIDEGLSTATAHVAHVRTVARQLGIALPGDDTPATASVRPSGGARP